MSPEELRQQIAPADLPDIRWRIADAIRSTLAPYNADYAGLPLEAADAILALPAIRRALARDAAIEAAVVVNGIVCRDASTADLGHGLVHASDLLARLRAVGDAPCPPTGIPWCERTPGCFGVTGHDGRCGVGGEQ